MTAPPLVLLLLAALGVEGVPNPRPAGSWVSDTANLLPPATEARIDHRLDAVERDLGVEIALVTVTGIDLPPKEFATRLFERWRIGKAGADNGLLVLLVLDQRRLEMETGYGLEPIVPDGWLSAMQAEAMVPAFRAGDYATGLESGLARLDERLRANAAEARSGRGGPTGPGAGEAAPGGAQALLSAPRAKRNLLFGGAAGLGLLGVGLPLLLRAARRRARTCRTCQIEMRLLDEVEDDAHLDAGQRTEERIGSVDHRVYICRQCQASHAVARKRWFSGFTRCPSCHYRARQTRSETLIPATYDHGGQVRVTETCRHCPHHRQVVRHTSRLTRSSSSGPGRGGSSSGGSFGGGRSGGGGAGSSW